MGQISWRFWVSIYYFPVFLWQEEELLATYRDIYDIVLTGDNDMTVVNSIVNSVVWLPLELYNIIYIYYILCLLRGYHDNYNPD